jgi:hypothetical protein
MLYMIYAYINYLYCWYWNQVLYIVALSKTIALTILSTEQNGREAYWLFYVV